MVFGETKTPIGLAISWLDGSDEVHHIYENVVYQLFVTNILSFATEGKELYYGAVRTPLSLYYSAFQCKFSVLQLVLS